VRSSDELSDSKLNVSRTAALRAAWLSNPRRDLLSGLVVALALIPESLAFAVIAGVDLKVALYAACTIAIVTSIVGGRSGMISAATGSIALVVTPLVHAHGVSYLFAATILGGALQVVLGLLRVGSLMRYIPRTVMLGFVDALGVLLLTAQFPQIFGHGWVVYALVAAGLVIMYGLPRITTVIPSPLIAITVLTAVVYFTGAHVPNVGEKGTLPSSLPSFILPDVPFTLHTLVIIAPYAATIAIVGLLESLLTAQLIDEITETRSNKDIEARGQGIANIAAGFLGGMGGCALIGQSMINMRNGGRTRLSTFASGVFLLVLIFVLAPVVRIIPMAALAAVMVLVAFTTFDWRSIAPRAWIDRPRSETAVLIVTVGIVLATHNLAIGVVVGVLLSAIFFAHRIAGHLKVDSSLEGSTRTYRVTGSLFFASANELMQDFDLVEAVDRVVIDLTDAHIWDSTATGALDAIVGRFEARGVAVSLTGLNADSQLLHSRLSQQAPRPS
jgi:SulP family sulfate permease